MANGESVGAACYDYSSVIWCQDANCAGSCTSANGCSCSDFTNCMPSGDGCPMEDNTCCVNVAGMYWDSTLRCCTDVPQCNPACLGDEVCNATNTVTPCTCNKATYTGIKVADLKPVVRCDGGVMIASVSQCQLEKLGYDDSSFHLSNNSNDCTFSYPEVMNSIHAQSIQVKATIGWCGNIVQNDSTKIYFTNTLHIDTIRKPLITKNPIVLNFTCEYNLTMQTSLNFSLNPVISTVVIPSSEAGTGSFTITMAAYSNTDFTTPIQENEEILVGSNIYLGLFCPTLDGSSFSLRVEKCFATPSSNRDDLTSVTLISGGCAVSGDALTVVTVNGNSSEARFQTSAFLFQGFSEVYIYCDVTLCSKADVCDVCKTARSGNADFSQVGIKLNLAAYDYSNSGYHTAASWSMLAASLLGLLSVKLF
ncbi:pancreatic secretory granule membrane major glycoprotein GP2-like [Rhinoderma darwinii]|uniref:pancreatic secretory granule membrane major glycoprotein GP2-like n=1 Tax=Rhinoderma darwinii TaxID=43563 RepID=UPI003F67C5B9